MKLQNSKRGFTIVELVIVIAVIAILAAVIISIFAGIVDKANQSSDTQLIRNLNTALAIEQVESKPTSIEEVAAALAKSNLNLPSKPSVTGYEFYWISSDNVIVLYNTETETVEFPAEYKDAILNEETWLSLETETGVGPYDAIIAQAPTGAKHFTLSEDGTEFYFDDVDSHLLEENYTLVYLDDQSAEFSFVNGCNITYDLNGHTITYTGDGISIMSFGKVGTVTFKDSSSNQTGLLISTDIESLGTQVINIESGNYQFEHVDFAGCSDGILTVKGGTFNFDPENSDWYSNPNLVPTGFHSENNGNGTWTVVKD